MDFGGNKVVAIYPGTNAKILTSPEKFTDFGGIQRVSPWHNGGFYWESLRKKMVKFSKFCHVPLLEYEELQVLEIP